MIRLANAAIEVTVDAERGAEILSVARPGGRNVLATYDWASPLRASDSSTYGDAVADWLSEYRGGWQEMFPNAGAPCVVQGVALPFHGEVSRARWQVVSQTADEVVLRTPARLPLLLERRMRLAPGAATLLIEETVRCDAAVPVDFLWGHHPAFEAVEGARIDLPAGVMVDVADDYRLPLIDLEPGGSAVWPAAPGLGGGAPVSLDQVPTGPAGAAGVPVRLRNRDVGGHPRLRARPGHGHGLGRGDLPLRLDVVGARRRRASVARSHAHRGHRAQHRGAIGWAGGGHRAWQCAPHRARRDARDMADDVPLRCR